MKKILFVLILILFMTTAGTKNNEELKAVFQVVKEDRGLHEWVLVDKEKVDDEDYYFYLDSEKNLNLIQFKIDEDTYYFHILYEVEYNDPDDYTYEDYDILYVHKQNSEWKIRYGGE